MSFSLKGLVAGAVVAASLVAHVGPAMASSGEQQCTVPRIVQLPGENIVTAAVAAGQFTTLAGVLQSTGLDKVLQGPGPFTVFAPTDAAFAKIPPAVLSAIVSDSELLSAVLTYHVVPGKKDFRYANDVRTLTTVQGEKVFARVTCWKGEATLRVNNSTVVVKPIAVDNGIIYVVNSVLLPQF